MEGNKVWKYKQAISNYFNNVKEPKARAEIRWTLSFVAIEPINAPTNQYTWLL